MRIFQIYQKVRYFISFYLPSPHKKSIPQKNSKKIQFFFKFPCTFLPKMKDKFDLYVGRKIPEQNTQERINKTLTEMASKFCFTSSRCELPYQLPLLISLRSGIKSQSIVETTFLTFYGRV